MLSGYPIMHISQLGISLTPSALHRLTAILISRLVLNLQWARRCTEEVSSWSQNTSFLSFDWVVGSIGESLGSKIAQGYLNVGDDVDEGLFATAAVSSDIVTGPTLSTADSGWIQTETDSPTKQVNSGSWLSFT